MTNLPAAISTALLRAEIDALLADWAWHLDHGDYDALVELFTEDALFVTGAVELRGRPAIKNRYTERLVARSTRHTYSGLRVYPVAVDSSAAADGRPALVSARSTWVNFAVNA
ncbi:MAG: nuclear transport factor 2 family protein, partial [Trebonia sp.]